MKIGYLISTHKNYNQPVNELLSSIYASGVEDSNVFIAEGGHDQAWKTLNNLDLQVTHNSFDYTALIEYIKLSEENNIREWTHLFPLHDTMLFGINTHRTIQTADPQKWCTAVWGGQCNLMLIKRDYILSRGQEILSWQNCTKKEAIDLEGRLFRSCPVEYQGSYDGNVEERGLAYPYNGSPRLVEYYSGIDLIKYKANYGQTNEKTYIVTP